MPLLYIAAVLVLPELAALALLATIQGLTEFLPISSSGHLVLAQSALGLSEPGLAIEVIVHLGTLLAVFAVYRRDILGILRGMGAGAWREPLLVLLATLPTVYAGLVHGDQIEQLFGSPRFAAKMLFVTAAILLIGEWARRRQLRIGPELDRAEEAGAASAQAKPGILLPTWWGALAIGLAQSMAIMPGISRSGSTIAVGLLVGLAPMAAARFSFLMAIPAILGAAVLKLPNALEQESGLSAADLGFSALIAAIVGWISLRLLLSFLGRGAFAWFALYCVLLGGVALFKL
ncbi:MAG: undecaprenyl-diphosphatase [Planctomycetota bacterium]